MHIKKDRSCSLLRLQQGAQGCSNVAFIEEFRTICFTLVATVTTWCHLLHLRHTHKNKPTMIVSFCDRKPHPNVTQRVNSINNLLLPQCKWFPCGSYVLLKRQRINHCIPASLLPQYVSESFTAAWLIHFMNEANDTNTLISSLITSGWRNSTEIPCYSMTVHDICLDLEVTL